MALDSVQLIKIGEGRGARVGGKAANLSRLASAGFPIPDGFVVPVEAFDAFLKENGLAARIADLSTSLEFRDDASLRTFSRRAKELVMAGRIGEGLSKEVRLAVSSGGPWAVRSSAMAEDLPEASFAGQQDTFLGVGSDEVLDSIKKCWASYWNERAVFYRHDAGVDGKEGGMAVVVQKMVDALSSGVIFTVDPVTGEDSILIESAWGLGETIVSGLVTPDRFVLEKGTMKVKERKVSRKTKEVTLSSGGKMYADVDEGRQLVPSVGDAEVAAIADLGRRIESSFGSPQDIEWASDGRKLYVLQSRPITTLKARGETLWTRAYGDEYWADVTSPLFFSTLGEFLSRYVLEEGYKVMGYKELAGLELLKLHKGHIYFNSKVLEVVFTYNPKFSRTKELLNYFPEKDQQRIAEADTKIAGRIWAEVRTAFVDSDGMITRTDKAYRKWASSYLEKMKEFDSMDLTRLSDDELYAQYRRNYEAVLKHYRLIRYGMVTHSIGSNLIMKSWLKDWLGDTGGELYSRLISGLPDNKTIITNRALSDLAEQARGDPQVLDALLKETPEAFLGMMESEAFPGFRPRFEAFMKDYGHRSHTRETFFPRWADDPTLVVGIVKSLAAVPGLDMAKLQEERLKERLETEKEVLEKVSKLRYGFAKKPVFKAVMGTAQTYLMFRENQRFYLDHMLFRERRLFMEYGRRFVERGLMDRQDDVFFLSKEEVFAMARGAAPTPRSVLAERRREFDAWRDRLPPKFVQGRVEFDDTLSLDEGVLHVTGTSASPGRATGPVRIVESIDDIGLVQRGDILVTSNTDPGWTPVFLKLGGLITETGGILSHGAVVSREYGLPAVTAVKNARKIFRNGQKVLVDGNEGTVTLLKE